MFDVLRFLNFSWMHFQIIDWYHVASFPTFENPDNWNFNFLYLSRELLIYDIGQQEAQVSLYHST